MKKAKKKTNGTGPIAMPPNVPKGAVVRGRHKEKLPCHVGAEEVSLAATELAKCVREQEGLDKERREALAGFREKQAGIHERQKSLAGTVELHTVARDVWCTDYLLPTGEIMIVREDTTEVVQTRTAEAKELQESLDGIIEDDEIPADALKGPQPDARDARPGDGG